MSKPAVTVGLTTWVPEDKPKRLTYLRRTLESFMANLKCGGCDVRFVIGAEMARVDLDTVKTVEAIAEEFGWEVLWHEADPMLARNLEHLWDHCGTPFYFNAQDDWVLYKELSLIDEVRTLEEHPDLAAIRYFWRDKGWNIGRRLGDVTFLEASGRARKGYFGHTPYLARLTLLQALRPLAPTELEVCQKAVELGLKVAVHHPPSVAHIGADTTIEGNTWQPIHLPDDWKPEDIE
jgi:hypothetical protein